MIQPSLHPSSSFAERLDRLLDRDPETPWLTLYSRRAAVFTRRDLRQSVERYLGFYDRHGVRAGDTVLIVLKESLDLFGSFLAAVAAGAQPAYFAYPSPKQSDDAFKVSLRHLAGYNPIRCVISFEPLAALASAEIADHSKEFLGGFSPESAGEASRPLSSCSGVPDAAFLQFSSGTTGAKKGVRIPAESLFNQLRAYAPLLSLAPEARVVSWLPHYHDMGLIACMMLPLFEAVPLVMLSPFDWVRSPASFLHAVTEHAATHVWLPNFALGHMTKSVPDDEVGQFDLSSLRRVVLCSEPALPETVRPFLRKFRRAGLREEALVNCYAMAENTFAMTSQREGPLRFLDVDRTTLAQDSVARRAGPGRQSREVSSAGTPLDNVELRIVDPRAGGVEGLSEGRVGEIAIRSDCMLAGYHRNQAATEAAMAGGWFKTGDLGFSFEGELYVTGRKKDVIVVGGENVFPQDVEAILNEAPGLVPGRNVVFGVDDPRVGTQRIVALAEVKGGSNGSSLSSPPGVDLSAVRAAVLNETGVAVSEIVLLPHMTLLKGTAGKVSRSLNREAFLRGELVSTASARASSPKHTAGPTTREIARAVVAEMVLDRGQEIGDDTPILSSGLVDSFALVELRAKLEAAFHVEIPESGLVTASFETVSDIARTVDALTAGVASPRVDPHLVARRRASLDTLRGSPRGRPKGPWIERLINGLPVASSAAYLALLRLAGAKVGAGVQFMGRLHVKLRGPASNIEIADGVVLGNHVDLRIRENGRIVLHPRVYIDDDVRIVAARDGKVEVGAGSEVGRFSVINSGGTTEIGCFCMIAANVHVNSSRHGTEPGEFVKAQPHAHGTVWIGDDVWIGAGASVVMNSVVGEGAVVASNSLVSGELPPMSVSAGVPARVLRYR